MAKKTKTNYSYKPIQTSGGYDIVILEELHSKKSARNDDTHSKRPTNKRHHIRSLILLAITIGLAISMFHNMRSEQSNEEYGSFLSNNKDDSIYHDRYYSDEHDLDKKSTDKLNTEYYDDDESRLREWDHNDDISSRNHGDHHYNSKSKSGKKSKKSEKHEKSKSGKHEKSKSGKHEKSKSGKHDKSKSGKHDKSKSGKHDKSKSKKKSGNREFSSSFDNTSSESWSSSFDSSD